MIIDHLCIAVKSLEVGIQHWGSAYGYQQMTEIVINSLQKVKVVFLRKKDSLSIKLIEPTDDSSPIYGFTKRGGGFHHICFKCDNVNDEIGRLKAHDVKVLVAPQPGEAFENEEIAFLLDKLGLNIELIDSDKRARRIEINQ